jgi:outer membrane protein OmpA-like peptidoglycan-associated protein
MMAAGVAAGQDVTVINKYEGKTDSISEEDYVLKRITEQRIIINEYELSNTGPRSHLEQMIAYGLRSMIDNNFHVFEGRVEALSSPEAFNRDASEVIRNAIWIHDQPFADEFKGLSNSVDEIVAQLNELDGQNILTGSERNEPSANGEVGLYTFQKMVYDLKMTTEFEASRFLDEQMPESQDRGYDESDVTFLRSKDYTLDNSDISTDRLGDLKPDFDSTLSEKEQRKLQRKNAVEDEGDDTPLQNDQFTARVVELLEQNSKILANYDRRFDNLQGQINELRDRQPAGNEAIREEIAELRSMIADLSQGKAITEPDGSKTAVVDEELTVIFEKNVYELTLAQKAKLNKADIALKQNPDYKALITGYADKSGNPNFNAWISKKRAQSVKKYLQTSGVEGDRLVVNFVGESESDSVNPQDRKVALQYLRNYGN